MSKYNVKVKLVGNDGNAFSIMGAVTKALKAEGATPEEIAEYRRDSMSGDYDHLLSVAHEWVNVR